MSDMILDYLLAAAAGFGAGFINVVAGGGSMISLPALIFLGLAETDANATNRVAILLQNVVAVGRYRSRGIGDFRLAIGLGLVACPTAAAGAWVASSVPDDAFRPIVGVALLVVLATVVWKPRSWLEGEPAPPTGRRRLALFAVFFVLGFYGGFLQVGIGLLILTALVQVGRRDLLQSNGTKVLVILIYTAFALATFAGLGEVEWRMGLALAAGNMAGAWVGTHAAIRGGGRFIRWVLIAVVAASALRLLRPWDLIG